MDTDEFVRARALRPGAKRGGLVSKVWGFDEFPVLWFETGLRGVLRYVSDRIVKLCLAVDEDFPLAVRPWRGGLPFRVSHADEGVQTVFHELAGGGAFELVADGFDALRVAGDD